MYHGRRLPRRQQPDRPHVQRALAHRLLQREALRLEPDLAALPDLARRTSAVGRQHTGRALTYIGHNYIVMAQGVP